MSQIRHNWDLVKGHRYEVIPRGPRPSTTRQLIAIAVTSAVPVGEDGIKFTCRLKLPRDDMHYDVEDFHAVFEVR